MSSPSPALLLAKLDAIRLDRDWSMRELAIEMDRQGCGISPRTLHYLLRDKPNTKPFDRTLHKIRVYLTHVRNLDRDRRRRRKLRAAKQAAPTNGVAHE
jgi:hypothetical protein